MSKTTEEFISKRQKLETVNDQLKTHLELLKRLQPIQENSQKLIEEVEKLKKEFPNNAAVSYFLDEALLKRLKENEENRKKRKEAAENSPQPVCDEKADNEAIQKAIQLLEQRAFIRQDIRDKKLHHNSTFCDIEELNALSTLFSTKEITDIAWSSFICRTLTRQDPLYLANLNMIDRMENLINLTVENICQDTFLQAIFVAVQRNKHLNYFKINHCTLLRGQALESLLFMVGTHPNLQTFDLSSNDIETDSAKTLGEFLKTNPKLLVLVLNHNNLGSEGAQHLAKGLVENNTLTNLNVDYCQIDISGSKALAAALKENHTLTQLSFVCGSIYLRKREDHTLEDGRDHIDYFSDALKDNIGLVSLTLERNRSMNIIVLADLLQHNTSLTSFTLDHQARSHYQLPIPLLGISNLAYQLVRNTSLRVLNLDQNHITDLDCEALTRALSRNQHLTDLSLGYCRLGERGVLAFAQLLRTNRAITSLNMCQNDITELAKKTFSEALAVNRSLTKLDIHTGFSTEYLGGDDLQPFLLMFKGDQNKTLTSFGAYVPNAPFPSFLNRNTKRQHQQYQHWTKITPLVAFSRANPNNALKNSILPLLKTIADDCHEPFESYGPLKY